MTPEQNSSHKTSPNLQQHCTSHDIGKKNIMDLLDYGFIILDLLLWIY